MQLEIDLDKVTGRHRQVYIIGWMRAPETSPSAVVSIWSTTANVWTTSSSVAWWLATLESGFERFVVHGPWVVHITALFCQCTSWQVQIYRFLILGGERERKKRRVCGGPIKFQNPSPQRGECNVPMAGVCAAKVYNFDAAWVCCHKRNSALKKIKYELSLRMRTSLVGTQPSSVLFCWISSGMQCC